MLSPNTCNALLDPVFSAMQLKSERSFGDFMSTDHSRLSSLPSTPLQSTQLLPQLHSSSSLMSSTTDMQCGSISHDKASPNALWAEYFDNFPTLAEFDLRSGVNNSTGSSLISSSSTAGSCGSWSSPGSGSPFSECEAEESPFDDHCVPTSVIDEIVQTLKMDGYNFDHLSDDIIDVSLNNNNSVVKQELDMTSQQCYMPNPVYTNLHPPKLQHMDHRKYMSSCPSSMSSMNNSHTTMSIINNNTMNININHTNAYEHSCGMDDKWCTSQSNTNNTPLPPISLSLQQTQSNNQLQQTNHHLMPIQQVHQLRQQQQHQQVQQPLHHHQTHPAVPVSVAFTSALIDTNSQQQQHQQQQQQHQQVQQQHQQHQQQQQQHQQVQQQHQQQSPPYSSPSQYSSPVFPGNYAMHSPTEVEPYSYSTPSVKSPITPQPPPLLQAGEKSAETKPRRRRTTSGTNRVEKPHVCKECGAAFKLSANLKQHQVIHTGEKPFSCEICKAMFTRLSSLKTHHRLHTGEKPHICPYCSAAFADRSAMKAHKRIHTGERPYKCQVCSTSFTQLSHLNAHKRTHTGEKPYACSVCSTTFKQLGHLKRHEKSHVCSRL